MGHDHNRDVSGSRGRVIKLAPGIQLSRDGNPAEPVFLVVARGKVRLNRQALAILELCDGSRSRDRVVVDAMLGAAGSMHAPDVVEFLDAAQSRGWIVDVEYTADGPG